MNNKPFAIIGAACVAAIIWTGCATRRPKEAEETIPSLSVTPNSGGLSLDNIKSSGPTSLLHFVNAPPDIPSCTMASIKRTAQNGTSNSNNEALGEISAVSIERPEDYNKGYTSFTGTIRQWKLLIDGENMTQQEEDQILHQDQLQEIPWEDAGRGATAKIRRCTFPWGKAILFLTTGYTQGPTPGDVVSNERLNLVMQGFTNDGRYTVNGVFSIHNPRLPDAADDKSQPGKVIFDWDKEDEKAAAWLDSQPDDSFQPTFAVYEAFLKSLHINPPGMK